MALWQWDFFILPLKEVTARFHTLSTVVKLEIIEAENWWGGYSKAWIIPFFDNILNRYSTPWAKNTVSWGSDDGDRIELFYDRDAIVEVVVRTDLRDLNITLLKEIAKFCSDSGLVIYAIDTGTFIAPDIDQVIGRIQRSRKAIFVEDAERFFKDKAYLDAIHQEAIKKVDQE